jgi:hypothetical protein
MTRNMSMLPDDIYDVFIIDAREHDDAGVMQLDLTITTGTHKGEVVTVHATNMQRDAIELIGMPARLRVHDGKPAIDFD